MTPPHLSDERATVRFGETVALDGVDLQVAAGEVVAVLGPSGSGKSTLLRVVAGLQSLDGGAVRIEGADQAAAPPHRRGVGMMFQDNALFPHRDVAGNVEFGLRMQGLAPEERAKRVTELLDLVALPGFGPRRIDTLSGGEQQRVALARALAPRPRALLLDEPLGSLDRSLRERLVVELRSIFVDLGLTVVAVTHDHDEAFTIADRIAVMDRGRLLQVGTPAEVWGRPSSRDVATVLGFPNVVAAVREDGTVRTPWGDARAEGRDGPVWAHIRPGGVRFRDVRGGPMARVVSSAFRGDRVAVRLEVAGAPVLHADLPAPGPDVGDEGAVELDAGAVVVLEP